MRDVYLKLNKVRYSIVKAPGRNRRVFTHKNEGKLIEKFQRPPLNIIQRWLARKLSSSDHRTASAKAVNVFLYLFSPICFLFLCYYIPRKCYIQAREDKGVDKLN